MYQPDQRMHYVITPKHMAALFLDRFGEVWSWQSWQSAMDSKNFFAYNEVNPSWQYGVSWDVIVAMRADTIDLVLEILIANYQLPTGYYHVISGDADENR